jgi:type VI secretion system protein ImpC
MAKIELPFVVGVIADLSGQPEDKPKPLKDREFVPLDRDNFNAVLAEVTPRLAFEVRNRLTREEEKLAVVLRFKHIEDFEPARVAGQVGQLKKLLDVRHQIEGVETTAKQRVAEIDKKLSAQLNEIMHHPDFQRLEATWRGLHYLVHQTETSTTLKIRVLNVSRRELFRDLEKTVELDHSALFKKVCEEPFGHLDGEPYGLLVGDYEFSHHPEDVSFLKMISHVAAAAHAPFVAGAGPQLFNFDHFTELTAPRDLAKMFESVEYASWKSFRESEDSRYVGLTLPHVLARLPYGANFKKVDQFNFEEFVDGEDHSKYLWMSAAWAYSVRVTDAFARYGWFARTRGVEGGGKVEGLASHTFPSEGGTVAPRGPTEIAISDRREFELSSLGFLPLLHGKDSDFAVFLGAQSCQKPKQYFDPAANANAELSAKLNHILCASRFVQYLKVMVRDRIDSFHSVQDCERWLNEWIRHYVVADTGRAGNESRVRSPLADARVEVREGKGKSGRYEVVAWLRPYFQLETLTASMRLVAEVPKKSAAVSQTADQVTIQAAPGLVDDIVVHQTPLDIKNWIAEIDKKLSAQEGQGQEATRKRLLETRKNLLRSWARIDRSGIDQPGPTPQEEASPAAEHHESLRHKLERVRRPRCQITYDDPDVRDIPPALPESIQRHTDVSFPANVPVGKTHNLRVQLVPAEEILPTGEVKKHPRSHPHDVTMSLDVPRPARMGEPSPPVRVIVSVAAENFTIESATRAEILVPLTGKSPAVNFCLRGQAVGPGRIMVDFVQEGHPVGSVDLFPEVVSVTPPVGDEPASGAGEVSLRMSPGLAPDVVLKVFELRHGEGPGRLHFHLFSTHPRLQDLPVLDGDLGVQDLRGEVAAWVENHLRTLGSVARRSGTPVAEVDGALADVGYQFYEQLLPQKLQDLCWTFRERGVRSVLVLSDEPHIPWELIKPYRTDPATGRIEKEDSFWGEAFAITHWLRGRPPAPRLSLRRVAALAAGAATVAKGVPELPRDLKLVSGESHGPSTFAELPANFDLPSANEELAVLRCLESTGAMVHVLPAQRQHLVEAFEQGAFDLLHLACHGSFGGLDSADCSAVLLEDGPFSATELSPRLAGGLRTAAPLIFFNACHSGRLGFSLTRLGSWGARLVQLGCGAFVGALWPVTDKAALAFARGFYELVAEGRPLGEVILEARQRVRRLYPQDPSWLAYRCFADPMARVEKPIPSPPPNKTI